MPAPPLPKGFARDALVAGAAALVAFALLVWWMAAVEWWFLGPAYEDFGRTSVFAAFALALVLPAAWWAQRRARPGVTVAVGVVAFVALVVASTLFHGLERMAC